jgi:sulfide dehydrogenase cytochrome subunit
MKQRWSTWALVAGALTVSAAASAAEQPSAAMLANACAGCHGTHGISAGAIPSLAGQSKTAIVEAMKQFKSGERPSSVMGRLAKGYTDQQIEALGEFFSKQKIN